MKFWPWEEANARSLELCMFVCVFISWEHEKAGNNTNIINRVAVRKVGATCSIVINMLNYGIDLFKFRLDVLWIWFANTASFMFLSPTPDRQCVLFCFLQD